MQKMNLTYEDYIRIAEYLGYNEDDLDVVKLDITNDGKVATYPTTVNASGHMGPVYEPVANILNNTDNIKVASVTGTGGKGVLESVGYKPPKTSDGGKLSEGDEKYNKTKQTMIKCLSANWYGTSDNKSFQEYIHEQADKLREYDDNSFKKAVLLNNSDGANTLGHNAVMLINKDNEAMIFSFYPTNSSFPDALMTEGEMRFTVLDANEVKEMLSSKNALTVFLVSSDNSVERETYDRFISYDLTKKGHSGYNIYHTATNIYDDPNYYSLIFRHCDDIACEILKKGGINPFQLPLPNWTYDVSNILNDIMKKD